MVCWPLEAVRATGADPIAVVVGREADAVREACGAGVTFAVQSEPGGTGHAVLAAEWVFAGFTGSVLVVNADLPLLRPETLRRLVAAQRTTGAGLSMLTATVSEPRGWGRVIRSGGLVAGIVEECDATDEQRAIREVNVGAYCVDSAVLFTTLHGLAPDNAQGEIYLTDVARRAVQAGIQVADVTVDAGEVGQINSRGELADMEKMLRDQINAKWMEAGVTLEDPDTAYIGPGVTIGRDTVIGPNVHLRGRTHVGEGCCFDGSAFLTDAIVGDRVHVRFGVVMTEARIGEGCQIGPFAHLRPSTLLAEEVHIGDFVETKNAVIGRRTKANHLAYIGDAQIGSESNIGAGTITCNYDGFRKHRTVIGDRVQVGSDTQLVAPVTLGDDVYVASGTTVRKDVPAGALVFNPRQQAQRSGWVAARRARESDASLPTTGRAGATSGGPRARAGVKAPRKARTKAATRARAKATGKAGGKQAAAGRPQGRRRRAGS